MDGFTSWMKRKGLSTSRVVASETTRMGYVMEVNVKCLKQCLHVKNNKQMFETSICFAIKLPC